MWIKRYQKKQDFIKNINDLNGQVMVLRGARQVGKTSFVLHTLSELKLPSIYIDCGVPSASFVMGIGNVGSDIGTKLKESYERLGRDSLGKSATDFINNVFLHLEARGVDPENASTLVFIDEADQYPPVLEYIQTLAEQTPRLKFIFTGSNLENIIVKNAATGRKKNFDLYPITFLEFLANAEQNDLIAYIQKLTLKNPSQSEYYHSQLTRFFATYTRLGGMPKIIAHYLDSKNHPGPLSNIISDLVLSIEDNVKSTLDEKKSFYEYHDVLKTMANLSLNTLKFERLQVNHVGRGEAKRLVFKTVGARVAHKIRLMDAYSDLSKYVLFDSGVVNFLLNGSELLIQEVSPPQMAILIETVVANELISTLTTRDDLFYWKSGNMAELDFMLRAPVLTGIDAKTSDGKNKSLSSFALHEENVGCLVKISDALFSFEANYAAKLPTSSKQRNIPLLKIPHYLTSRLPELLREL